MNSIFLSYARADDVPFVRRLYGSLTGAGFKVWLDRESLLSRGLTFHQEIKDAIRTEVARVVYVGGPQASISPYVREEWQFALEYDHVVVTPILRLGGYENLPGELSLLHCEDFREDANYNHALSRLIASLRQPNPKLGALFAVPSLPPNILSRPQLMLRVRDALIVHLQKPQVITSADAPVGIQGMGGIGKSVLAAVIGRNRQVRQAYPDGIVWISSGQQLTDQDVLKRLRDMARFLGGEDTFNSLAQGQASLRQMLADKAVLLVLDDVWSAGDAQAFDVLGRRCRMLITTRDKGILDTLRGELVPVSLLTETEALQLLADAISTKDRPVSIADLPTESREVVHECGRLPLCLALCGGMARKRAGDFQSVLERLRRAHLEKIADRESINERHRTIWRAMQASVEMLSVDEQQRFCELSVFDTDQTVPEGAAATLWAHTGGFDELDTEELLVNLFERSLVQLDQLRGDDGRMNRCFRLHDLLYDYAVRIAGERRALHLELLDAYKRKCPKGWASAPNDGYFLQNLCDHLVAAGRTDDAVALLTDLPWVETKCRAKLVFSLQDDYASVISAMPDAQERLREERERQERLDRWTRELTEYSRMWSERRNREERGEKMIGPGPQLPELPTACRIWTDEEIEAECRRISETPTRLDMLAAFTRFVQGECYSLSHLGGREGFTVQHAFNHAPGGPVHETARGIVSQTSAPLLLRHWPNWAAWNHKSSLLRTLEGHRHTITTVSVTPDGRRAVSASYDKTIRIWDLQAGQCERTVEGDGFAVYSVTATPDGHRAVSGGNDGTLRIWDLESGTCLLTLEGHCNWVNCVSMTPDGRRAVSGGWDGMLRVWDLDTGTCLCTLEGHSDRRVEIKSVSIAPDGSRAVSGGWDGLLRVWDLKRGSCVFTLEVHRGRLIESVSITPDGHRAVCGGWDGLLVWDLDSGTCLCTLEGHDNSVTSVSVTPDGRRAVSGGEDNTMRAWDLDSGTCLRTLEGHNNSVTSVSVTADGRRAVTGSSDRTVRVWDLESGQNIGTSKWRNFFGTPFPVWDILARVPVTTMMPDGRRAVSACEDNALRLWDLESCTCLRTLQGHSGRVTRVSVTADGRLAVTGSFDGTVRVWDLEQGTCVRTLEGHTGPVSSVSVTPDGRRAVSGCSVPESAEEHSDDKLRLWDVASGICLRVLEGYTYGVNSVSVTPDGRRAILASQYDSKLRVWDLDSGVCLRILEGHQGFEVKAVCAMPDARHALSAGEDKVVRVWDLETGCCLRALRGHRSSIESVSITAEGRRAVSGGWDNTVMLWDVESGASLAIFAGAGCVDEVAVSSKFLVIGTHSKELLVLELCGLTATPLIVPPGSTQVDTSDAAYEASLRRALDCSRRIRGPDHEETLAHLTALAALLEKTGSTDEARSVREEHDQAAAKKRQNK